MSNKNDRINVILQHLTEAAQAAAEGVSDAAKSATQAVGDKYDVLKLNMELSRLHNEQDKLFTDIGHTMFLLKTGAFVEPLVAEPDQPADAQQMVDHLLVLAEQKQQEIDAVAAKLSKLSGKRVCAVCGKAADSKDAFCSACGAHLKKED